MKSKVLSEGLLIYAQCTKTYYTFFLGMSDEVVALKVSQMFASLDVDGNGLISEEEFVLKCQEGKIAVRSKLFTKKQQWILM